MNPVSLEWSKGWVSGDLSLAAAGAPPPFQPGQFNQPPPNFVQQAGAGGNPQAVAAALYGQGPPRGGQQPRSESNNLPVSLLCSVHAFFHLQLYGYGTFLFRETFEGPVIGSLVKRVPVVQWCAGMVVNKSSDRSCTRGVTYNQSNLISPGCPQPSRVLKGTIMA